jgi:hypothetical protein
MKEEKVLPVSELAHKLTLNVFEARAVSGLALALIEAAIKDGSLKRVTIGKATVIKRKDLDAWVDSLETETPTRFAPPDDFDESL